MNTANRLETGYGLEMEGFIVTEDGTPASLTRAGEPLIAWLQHQWRVAKPGAADLVSAEQLAHMVEIKSHVVDNHKAGLEMIHSIRAELNRLLVQGAVNGEIRRGLRIIFVPVLAKKPDLIPASNDPSSRSYQLVQEWGATSDGMARLYDTAIASCQLNDSVLFAGLNAEQSWALAAALYNHYSYDVLRDLMQRFNTADVNHEGMTRRECLERLLPGVKGAQFLARGYDAEHVIYPPRFSSSQDVQDWYCAHSNVENFCDAACKNTHGLGLKVKLDSAKIPFMVETRWVDASEDVRHLLRAFETVTHINRGLRAQLALVGMSEVNCGY